MKKLTITLLLALAACTSFAQLPAHMSDRLNTMFDSLCTRYKLQGASAAIVVPGSGIWTAVYGESHSGVPVEKDMLFGIGSNTKIMTAAALLRLQELQLVDLDDTIGRWFVNKPNINGQITIRQMLNHTSGLHNYTRNEAFYPNLAQDFTRIWEKEELLNMIDTPYFTPGNGWIYSNTNYLLAGIIIEKVTGKPVEQVLQEQIFTPGKLTRTYYYPQQVPGLTVADPWSSIVTGSFIDLFDAGYSNSAMFSAASSAGAVMQTAEDNARFWNLVLNGKLFNKASLDEMLEFVYDDGVGYGLGVFKYPAYMLNNRVIYTHGGTNIGYINENLIDSASGICISVLTNQDKLSNGALFVKVVGELHKATIAMRTGVAEEAYNNSSMSIFPNPAGDIINITVEKEGSMTVSLHDMTGREVLVSETFSGNITISASGINAGVYYMELKDRYGNPMAVKKVRIAR